MTPATWYDIKASATTADIKVHDWIGRYWDPAGNEIGVSAKALLSDLSKLPATVSTITVRVNSPGGDVFDALTIANALFDQREQRNRRVETIVDALAASAASLIAVAGDPVTIVDNGLMMVHLPHTRTVGNQHDHRKTADLLDKVTAGMIATYRRRTTKSEAEVRAMLEAETWLDAENAVASGLATRRTGATTQATAAQAMAMVDRQPGIVVPDAYRARLTGRTQPDPFGWHKAIRADRPTSKYLRTPLRH